MIESEEDYKVEYFPNGNKKYETWYKNGKEHRDNNLPSSILYSNEGEIMKLSYCNNGLPFRENDLPNSIFYHFMPDCIGKKWIEFWENADSYHRENGKASLIEYYTNGTVKNEEYYYNGILFRLGLSDNYEALPTKVSFDPHGKIKEQEFRFESKYYEIVLNPSKIIRIVYHIKKYIKKFVNKKRSMLFSKLKQTRLNNTVGSDICGLIIKFF